MSSFDKFLNPVSCANNKSSPCPNKANNACGRCYLVVVSLQHFDLLKFLHRVLTKSKQYCSKECQKEHWPTHKEDCNNALAQETWKPDWHTEDRDPTFFEERDLSELNPNIGKISWWGSMPALDLLKLDANEGQDPSPNMRVLLICKRLSALQQVPSTNTICDSITRYPKRSRNNRSFARYIFGAL